MEQDIRTNNTRTIDFAAAIEIHQLARHGVSHIEIAQQFNCHRCTVEDVLSGKTYAAIKRMVEAVTRNHARLNGSDLKW